MLNFFEFLRLELFQCISTLVICKPFIADFMVHVGINATTAELLHYKFDGLAPSDERTASGNPFKRKWYAPDAAKFLARCAPVTAAAVLIQWDENSELKKKLNAHKKINAVIDIWLTHPDLKDNKEIPKMLKVLTPDIFFGVLENTGNDTAFQLVLKIREKKVRKALEKLATEAIVYLLNQIRQQDELYFYEILNSFPAQLAMQIDKEFKYFARPPLPYGMKKKENIKTQKGA